MVSKTNEQALESAIEKFLTGRSLEELDDVKDEVTPFSQNHGYKLDYATDYIAQYAIEKKFFWQFLQNTQKEKLEH